MVRIHPGLLEFRKGYPMGDGNRLEAGGALIRPCGFNSRSFRSILDRLDSSPGALVMGPWKRRAPELFRFNSWSVHWAQRPALVSVL